MTAGTVFTVPSASTGGSRTVEVRVAHSGEHAGQEYLFCSCPGWKWSLKSGGCKHVKAVAQMAGIRLVDGTHVA